MIQSSEDLEGFLIRLERPYERVSDGTYLVRLGSGAPLVALRISAPVLVVRAEVGAAPTATEASALLFRRLLEWNAGSLLHAAYGLEGERIVLGAALELANLDLNELEAVLADVELALSEHVPTLHGMIQR